ncbi:MAG: hypothetical protein R2688_06270 [Fimbriimonadaceae bacterium]
MYVIRKGTAQSAAPVENVASKAPVIVKTIRLNQADPRDILQIMGTGGAYDTDRHLDEFRRIRENYLPKPDNSNNRINYIGEQFGVSGASPNLSSTGDILVPANVAGQGRGVVLSLAAAVAALVAVSSAAAVDNLAAWTTRWRSRLWQSHWWSRSCSTRRNLFGLRSDRQLHHLCWN